MFVCASPRSSAWNAWKSSINNFFNNPGRAVRSTSSVWLTIFVKIQHELQRHNVLLFRMLKAEIRKEVCSHERNKGKLPCKLYQSDNVCQDEVTLQVTLKCTVIINIKANTSINAKANIKMKSSSCHGGGIVGWPLFLCNTQNPLFADSNGNHWK